MSPVRPRRLWGEGLRLVPRSRLDGRRMRPWNLARLGLRLRCRFILPGLGLRDLGASKTRVLSSSSSELLPELSVGLLPSSDLGREICTTHQHLALTHTGGCGALQQDALPC